MSDNPFRNPHPLVLTEEQRKRMSTTLILQKPPSEAAVEEFAELARRRKTIEGLSVDVVLTLEAIRMLAEQGNRAAEWLYWRERQRLGIDIPKRVHLNG